MSKWDLAWVTLKNKASVWKDMNSKIEQKMPNLWLNLDGRMVKSLMLCNMFRDRMPQNNEHHYKWVTLFRRDETLLKMKPTAADHSHLNISTYEEKINLVHALLEEDCGWSTEQQPTLQISVGSAALTLTEKGKWSNLLTTFCRVKKPLPTEILSKCDQGPKGSLWRIRIGDGTGLHHCYAQDKAQSKQ